MLGKLFGGDPIEGFWRWFAKNEDRIFNIETGMEPVLSELVRRLRRIHPSLTVQAGPVGEGRQLEVSADGDREAFATVLEVVAAAPALPRWRIVAFRQRAPEVEQIRVGDMPVSIDQMFFRSSPDDGKLGLELFIEGFSEEKRGLYSQAAFLLLDAILGEYDVESKVSFIEFEALASYQGSEPLRPLRELAAFVDALDS